MMKKFSIFNGLIHSKANKKLLMLKTKLTNTKVKQLLQTILLTINLKLKHSKL